MPDDNTAPPIVAEKSPARDQAEAAIRYVVLGLSVSSTLAGLIAKRDLNGFVAFMQSSDALTLLAGIIAAATFAWGQWKARHRSQQLTAIGADPRVPDDVVTIKK